MKARPPLPKHDPIKIDPQTIFLSEFGLYSLMLSSKLPQAKEFKRWVTSDVIPSIRRIGQYVEKEVKEKLTFNLQSEADLQKAMVNYLRTKYPNVYFQVSLGELQDTNEKRIESYYKGYQKGSPDLIIFFRNKKYNGLAIEFKSPKGNGVLTPEQNQRLLQLKEQNFDVIVSNNIFEITEKICLHINFNKIPQKKTLKVEKPKVYKKTILEYLI